MATKVKGNQREKVVRNKVKNTGKLKIIRITNA
jgi:hypothetical protein